MPNRRKKLTILFSLLIIIELGVVVVLEINWGIFVSWMKPSREKLWCLIKLCSNFEPLSLLFKKCGFSTIEPVRLCNIFELLVLQISFWFKSRAYISVLWISKKPRWFGGGSKLNRGGGRIKFTRCDLLFNLSEFGFWQMNSWQISFLECSFLRLLRWRWGRR